MGDGKMPVQFCLAQLICDVKFLTTLPEPSTVAYGQQLLWALRAMFHVAHQMPGVLQQALEHARDQLVIVGKQSPEQQASQKYRQTL